VYAIQHFNRSAAEVGKATMKELFDEMLILSRAQQMRVVITGEQVDRAAESSRKRFGIPTQEEFEAALAQSGMTLDFYRKRLEKQLQTQEVLGREIQPRVKVYEEVLLRYYREHPAEFVVPERVEVREFVVSEAAKKSSAERAA
jgi:foldase protein PrsA